MSIETLKSNIEALEAIRGRTMKSKTLNDVIEEMTNTDGFKLTWGDMESGVRKEVTMCMMVACEAMLREIVPEERGIYYVGEMIYTKGAEGYASDRGYNACRSDILERAKEFMGDKK